MAEQIKVDSRVMRNASQTLQTEAGRLFSQFEAMQQEVASFARRMRGTTIETAERQFSAMRPTFENIRRDMQAYSQFLMNAADEFEQREREGTSQAQQQGRIF